MQVAGESSEAEMIAAFLGQEWDSQARYGEALRACLREEGADPTLITEVDLDDHRANARRRALLRRYRGYGSGQPSYLTDFPDSGVHWFWATLVPEELLACRYIRYEYWAELAAGTRSPITAAERVRAGIQACGVGNDDYWSIVERLRNGWRAPPPILVRAHATDAPVVLEGHARITAYALAPDLIPDPVTVLVGESSAIAGWDEY